MAIFKLFSQEVNSFVSSLQFVPRALKSALSEDSDYFSSGEESERSSSPESHCEVRAEGKMFPQSLKSLFSKIENKANAQEGRTGVQPLGTNPWGPTPGVQPHAQKGRVGDQPRGTNPWGPVPCPKGQSWGPTPCPRGPSLGHNPCYCCCSYCNCYCCKEEERKKKT